MPLWCVSNVSIDNIQQLRDSVSATQDSVQPSNTCGALHTQHATPSTPQTPREACVACAL